MPTVCGIDEAGRGPVIGSLFMAGVLIDSGQEEALKSLGVKDSKLLTPKRREELFAKIIDLVKDYKIIRVLPQEVDAAVQSKDQFNLNWLEAVKAVEILNELKPDESILDCPSPNIKAYSQYVEKRLKKKQKLICAHHADADYVVVGAASILAKVKRDEEIAMIKKRIGVDLGSGYITDPKTVAFVESYWNKYPEIFRHSWKTFKKAAQQTLGKFE